jgi:putative FmdB family regulatory protein
MPTYEYRCRKCKKRFERYQRMTEAPLKTCIYCKGRTERLIGAGAGFIFKGSGFYATDYRKSSPPAKTDSRSAGDVKGKSAEKPKETPKKA